MIETLFAYHSWATDRLVEALQAAVERWRSVDEQAQSCLDGLDDGELAETWTWDLPSGETVGLPLWQLLSQVANHQTHTRAQIVAAVRRAGHDPGVYEFLAFAMERAGS